MRILILSMSFTLFIHPMQDIVLSLAKASVAGLIAYSAKQQQEADLNQHSSTLTTATLKFTQLKDTLSKKGMLVKGTGEVCVCNPINTLFNRAIEQGNIGALELILNLCPTLEINDLDESGSSALQVAGRHRNTPLVEYLLKKGARPDLPDIAGITPFQYAMYENDIETIDCMIKQKPELAYVPLDEHKSTALHFAVQAQDYNLSNRLLGLNINPNTHNRHGMTPLHFAAQAGNVTAIMQLINANAELNALDNDGMTPLHHAVNTYVISCRKISEGRASSSQAADQSENSDDQSIAIIKVLIQAGADPHKIDNNGMAPIHYAAQEGNILAIETLIKEGASPNLPTEAGETIAMIALREDMQSTLNFLLELRQDASAKSDFLINIKDMIIPAIKKISASSSNGKPCESARLVIRRFFEANPECDICYEQHTGETNIASCCKKIVCASCVKTLPKTQSICAFCRTECPELPFITYSNTPSLSSDHRAASSSD